MISTIHLVISLIHFLISLNLNRSMLKRLAILSQSTHMLIHFQHSHKSLISPADRTHMKLVITVIVTPAITAVAIVLRLGPLLNIVSCTPLFLIDQYNTIQYNTIVFISQNKPLSGYKRNYSDNALGITVHKRQRRRLNVSSGCFIDVGLCRLYTLTERTRREHIPHKHKERNK